MEESCPELNMYFWIEAWTSVLTCRMGDDLSGFGIQRLRSAGNMSESSCELIPFSVSHLAYRNLVKAQHKDLDLLLYFCARQDVQTSALQGKAAKHFHNIA